MIQEMADRMIVGWSREQLAQASNVEVASVYLLERMGTAGQADDARIRTTLAHKKWNMLGEALITTGLISVCVE